MTEAGAQQDGSGSFSGRNWVIKVDRGRRGEKSGLSGDARRTRAPRKLNLISQAWEGSAGL